jgi:hypothetical protein
VIAGLAALFASGRIVDIVLAFTVVEALGLAAYHRLTGRGIAMRDVAATLLSGLCLMIALRCVLSGAWWGWVGLCLSGALVAHVADLARRWHTERPSGENGSPNR